MEGNLSIISVQHMVYLSKRISSHSYDLKHIIVSRELDEIRIPINDDIIRLIDIVTLNSRVAFILHRLLQFAY